jgi:hypothetical protein
VSILLATSSFVSIGSAAPTEFENAVEIETRSIIEPRGLDRVWRADKRSPAEIEKSKGFWAKGYSIGTKFGADISLYTHVKGAEDSFMSKDNDGYVSFTSDKALAESWINKYHKGDGYVYEVATYGNLIDVQETLKAYNTYPQEREFAAIKGVELDQVMGWNRFRAEKKGKGVKDPFTPSKYYNKAKYTGKPHGGAQYALAGFPRKHPAWKEDPWYFYVACSVIYQKRSGVPAEELTLDVEKRTTPAKAAPASKGASAPKKAASPDKKGAKASKGDCGPAETNQKVAEEYYNTVMKGQKFVAKKVDHSKDKGAAGKKSP